MEIGISTKNKHQVESLTSIYRAKRNMKCINKVIKHVIMKRAYSGDCTSINTIDNKSIQVEYWTLYNRLE